MEGRSFACLAVILWLLVGAEAVKAQSVRVTSGEHDGFSRIVLQFPGPVAWRLSRTDDGYQLMLPGMRPRYDLTDVFRLIPRDRLSAIFADPQTGALTLTVGCACHAMPFELRPGIVVIDIRTGRAPAGSSFEQTAGGALASPLEALPSMASTPRRPNPRPALPVRSARPDTGLKLDWRGDVLDAARIAPLPDLPPFGTHELGMAREALIRQLGRGAAEGVVDFTQSLRPAPVRVRLAPPDLDHHLRIGPEPGLDADAGRRVPGMLTPDGGICLTDEALDLAAWGQTGDVATSLGHVRAAVLGEFDQPDETATTAAIRYFLHLGFGAEAREYVQHFSPSSGFSSDRGMWLTLAAVLDGDPVDQNPFEGMQGCDSAAALWAVLAAGVSASAPDIDKAALFRSFSALPLHLRRHLGPELARLFREAGDLTSAGTIRNAILRAPGEAGAMVRLMEAELQLAQTGDAGAEPLLQPLIAGSGPTAIEASVRLIMAQVAEGRVVDEALITTAQAFLHEASGHERSAPITEALALGLATHARLAEAMRLPDLSEETGRKVWDLFATHADDNTFLASAVGVKPPEIQQLATPTRLGIATRLIAAGLFRPALDWLSGQTDGSFRIVRAQAYAGLRDWRAVLQELAGLEEADALKLRAEAMAALDDPDALNILLRLDDPEARRSTARRLGVWTELLDATTSDPWAAAAQLLTGSGPEPEDVGGRPGPPPPDAMPMTVQMPEDIPHQPLEAARQRIAESRVARDRIVVLLEALRAEDRP